VAEAQQPTRIGYREKVAQAMKLSALASRLDAVRANGGFTPAVIDRFTQFLDEASDLQLYRMSPLRYAAETDTDQDTAVDLFLHATHAGILEFNWGVICPQCGSFLNTAAGLKSLNLDKRCQLCVVDVKGTIDENVEIAFTVSPTVRTIRYHSPADLNVIEDWLACMFSRSAEFDPKFKEIIQSAFRGSHDVPAGSSATFTYDLTEKCYSVLAPFDHVAGYLNTEADGPREVVLELLSGRIVPDDVTVGTGPVKVTVHNRTSKVAKLAFMVNIGSMPAAHAFTGEPLKLKPFLTGKRLVTSQTFRDLFNTESIPSEGGLEFKNLTLLFTDLKGSTEMYRRIGDFRAYSLVREHFAVLKKIVTGSGGAVVKTIGDAIMASFADPASALEAAAAMGAAVRKVGGGEDLVLKIGIHSGPCIAVELNERLDYFGQAVNIAARVQGVAGAGEIVASREVYAAPRVRDVLSAAGLVVKKEQVALKGVSDSYTVYRMTPSVPAAAPAPAPTVDKAQALV